MTDADLFCRALTLADAGRCAAISTAISARAGANEQIHQRDLRKEWTEPDFNLNESSLGIVDGRGLLLGYAALFANEETPVRPWFGWGVDPDNYRDSVSTQLLAWAHEQGKAVIPRCPPDARVSLWAGTYKGYRPDEESLEKAGYQPRRAWHEMRIDMTEPPAPAALPAGFGARPYRHDEDLPLLVDLVRDSFSDHYGHIEQSFERDLALFRHWFEDSPYFDPDLVMLAADEATGAIVGSLLPLTEYHRRPGVGYIDMVGVRKAWRRRGLASAMLRRSFALYWDRGIKSVCLEVDGESLTNALALYERVGMRVQHSFVSYELLLRDGVELAKVALA